jgi:hydrogenase maturation protease
MNATSGVLVVCVGNGLAGDDAVGEAVYRRLLIENLPESVRVIFLGLGGLSLLDYFHGQHLLIVVDAVQLNGRPGFIHVLETEQMPVLRGQAVSLHGIGLLEALSVSRTLYPESVPKRTILVGIEGKNYNELGAPLSHEVVAAVEQAIVEIKRQITRSTQEEL